VVKSKYVLSLLVLATITLPAHALAAATPKATKGISISPFLKQVDIQSTEATKSFMLTLTNRTDSLQELQLSGHDFGSLNDSGGVLLDGANNYTQKYGLASWLTIGTDTVILQPKESRDIPVTINNRDSLRPGGHYGAVVASVKGLDTQTGNHVAINQQLLSLILANKVGGERYDLKLKSISENGNWLHLPNTIKLRFQNPGNVHVVPRGTVKLVNPAGKTISQGIINDGSAYILPESFREIYVPLKTTGHPLELPGIYRVEVNYRYDGLATYATKTKALHYADLKLYAGIFIIIGLLVYAIRHKKTTRKNNK
jgi:hypothetical protein